MRRISSLSEIQLLTQEESRSAEKTIIGHIYLLKISLNVPSIKAFEYASLEYPLKFSD